MIDHRAVMTISLLVGAADGNGGRAIVEPTIALLYQPHFLFTSFTLTSQ